MNKKILLMAVAIILSGNAAMAADQAQLKKETVIRIQAFGKSLKGEFKKAMDKGGAAEAVDVCHGKAPALAQNLSNEGWVIGRTSRRWRNSANRPDDWESKVLAMFEEQKNKGADISKLAFGEIVEEQNGKTWRFMKAIPTGAVCTTCHGTDVKPDLKAKLKANYPQDRAFGFKEGDIRGAFTVRKKL